jgi:hypothetical protein
MVLHICSPSGDPQLGLGMQYEDIRDLFEVISLMITGTAHHRSLQALAV